MPPAINPKKYRLDQTLRLPSSVRRCNTKQFQVRPAVRVRQGTTRNHYFGALLSPQKANRRETDKKEAAKEQTASPTEYAGPADKRSWSKIAKAKQSRVFFLVSGEGGVSRRLLTTKKRRLTVFFVRSPSVLLVSLFLPASVSLSLPLSLSLSLSPSLSLSLSFLSSLSVDVSTLFVIEHRRWHLVCGPHCG